MTTDMVAGGSRTIALALGKTGAHVSVSGNKPKSFPIKGTLNAASLAAALDMFTSDGITTTILVIGTRADGTPGWDQIDPDELTTATPHDVFFFSEAQALALEPGGKEPAAWIILATAKVGGTTKGSARWWVHNSENGTVKRVDVEYLGTNFGQVYTLAGGNLSSSPAMVAGMVESVIMRHPGMIRVYVWSQDGMSKLTAYERGANDKPNGQFWASLRLPEVYEAAGGDVVIVPHALNLLQIASKNGVPAATETTPKEE